MRPTSDTSSSSEISPLRSLSIGALFSPIDIAPLVYFRVLFGVIMLWEVTRYYSNNWIERYYIEPDFFFTYFGFSWIHPLPGYLMYVFFLGLGILAVFFGIQILLPLRHHLYSGNVNWTEEGHTFAWHMKLRSKRGSLRLTATDPLTKESWVVNQYEYLSSRQRETIIARPDMIVLFSHHLRDVLEAEGRENIEIRAIAHISLNGRKYQDMIDPTVDLTKVERSLWPSRWIVPLSTPRRGQTR